MKNYYLLRSPEKIFEEGYVGYGWNSFNFMNYSDSNLLLKDMKSKTDIGRQANQIKRFFEIKEGDILILPIYQAIYVAVASSERRYQPEVKYGGNQVKVQFLQKNGKKIRIPRSSLTTAFSSRLKVRMTSTSLEDFAEEIETLWQQVSNLDAEELGFTSHVQAVQQEVVESFEKQLLSRLREGKVGLASGGYGLEKLVKELVEIEGYTAKIAAKNRTNDDSDIDVIAERNDELTSNRVYIQVKHHDGFSSEHGINQLIQIDDEETSLTKVFITTGDVEDKVRQKAEANNVVCKDGQQFIAWVINNWKELSTDTKLQLGIVDVPRLI